MAAHNVLRGDKAWDMALRFYRKGVNREREIKRKAPKIVKYGIKQRIFFFFFFFFCNRKSTWKYSPRALGIQKDIKCALDAMQ
jgi:hypothetical protein